jgi:hypothetical protein
MVSTYAASRGRQRRCTRRQRNAVTIADRAACSDGMAATRLTLACPESIRTPADCRCRVPQPRVEIRSMNLLAPG